MYSRGNNYYSLPIQDNAVRSIAGNATLDAPRLLTCKYKLTAEQYLEIGYNVAAVTTIDIIIGEENGAQLRLPYATWMAVMEQWSEVQQFLTAENPQPLYIHNLLMDYDAANNVIQLHHDTYPNSGVEHDTIVKMYYLESSVEEMYTYMLEHINIVEEQLATYVCIVSEIGIMDVDRAISAIRDSIYSDPLASIDRELLTNAIDTIMYLASH